MTSEPINSVISNLDTAFGWMDLVGVPVLLIERDTLLVTAANTAAQTRFGPNRLGALPRPFTNLAADGGAAKLADAFAAIARGETDPDSSSRCSSVSCTIACAASVSSSRRSRRRRTSSSRR